MTNGCSSHPFPFGAAFASGKDLPIDEWIRLGRCRSSVAKVCTHVMQFSMISVELAVPTGIDSSCLVLPTTGMLPEVIPIAEGTT